MKRTVSKSASRTRVDAPALSLIERRQLENELREAEERIALSALDALTAHIAILDREGTILAVNKAWRDFGREAGADADRGQVGTNYFSGRDADSSAMGQLVDGVRAVLAGDIAEFHVEYPYVKGRQERWFHARVTRFGGKHVVRAVVSHEDISERVQMEREIVAVSAREQQRFGQELHDGLSQQLTGLKFKASLLEYQLQSRQLAEANDAKGISELLNQATDEAAKLARSVRPVEIESRGLMMALKELAGRAQQHGVHGVCEFRRPVFIHDNNVATQAYRIAEEAVTNAMQHGEPTEITIALRETKDCVILTVRDNGKGLPKNFANSARLGIHMMRYRARMIGGSVEFKSENPRGTLVTCRFQKQPIGAARES
jgi:signal transduction histidine kinase